MAPRLSGQNCKFFNSQKRLRYKENNTEYRSLTRKPRSHVRILIYRTWPIVIKVRCGAQPQHHGAASRERKLTMTLLIVTVVSLLLCLPYVVSFFAIFISKPEIYLSLPTHFDYTMLFLFYANSLVNPILYAIRMPEYRSAFLFFPRRAQQQRQGAVLPLRNM